jgi:phage recombination protein Bet
MAREAQAMTIAPRHPKPANYNGTAQSWRVLTDAIWPSARSSESIQLALSYCAARNLDPFKRPVHIVPVWNSALRREVETVWPGISELLTVASRSKQFAGVDEPREGPMETRTFTGTDREGDTLTKTVTFPLWSSVTVYRMVAGVRVSFTQPVYWLEAYARQGFRSEIPNDMWTKRPHGQLHKCALAAALRLGFPEDIGGDYAAEEMEGREIERGGVIIDEVAERETTPPPGAAAGGTAPERVTNEPPLRGPASRARVPPDSELTPESGEAARERQAEVYADPPKPSAIERLEQAPSAREWLKALERGAREAASTEELAAIATHASVRDALANYPTLIQSQIRETLRLAHERLAPQEDEQPDPPDPLADLLAEVEAMDLVTLTGLSDNAAWTAKLADLFPSDFDRIDEAVTNRRISLTQTDARFGPLGRDTDGQSSQEALTRDDHSPPEANPGP